MTNTTKFQIESNLGNKKDFSGQDEYYYPLNEYVRFRLSAWSRNFALYASNGIQEECQVRSSTSTKYKVNYMGAGTVTGTTSSGTALIGNPAQMTTITNSDTENNSKRVNVTLNYLAGTGVYIVTDYINANYTFTYQGTTRNSSKTWN